MLEPRGPTTERTRSAGIPQLVAQIAELDSTPARVEAAIVGLRTLLHADVAAFNQVDFSTGASASRGAADGNPSTLERLDRRPDLLARHPLVAHYVLSQDWQPRLVSDVATPAQWERHRAAIAEWHAPSAARHILVMPLCAPTGVALTAAVARFDGSDFGPEQQEIAARLQPALIALGLGQRAFDDPDQGEAGGPGHAPLTGREHDVLRLLASGLTAYGIARHAGISPGTVRKHLENIYAKLGQHDRLAAVTEGRRRGLL